MKPKRMITIHPAAYRHHFLQQALATFCYDYWYHKWRGVSWQSPFARLGYKGDEVVSLAHF